jgi:flagellar basal body-associated protein FliL
MLRFFRRQFVVLVGLACVLQFPIARAGVAEEAAPSKPTYLVLGEFTVNMPGDDSPLGYIVVGITVEAMPAALGELRDITPRLKEAVMRRLMVLAERGALQPGRTDPAALKTALIDSIDRLRPDSVRDVLITRLIYG